MKERKYLLNDGKLILAYAEFHKDIPVNHNLNRGGGKWWIDREEKVIYLYDFSAAYGIPEEEDVKKAILPRALREYTVSFQPEAEHVSELKTLAK